ncbi:winged helix-turn-helix domain-containing protein [Dokdonella koreensis]|uniref:Trans_reg_C domain containing protein n=1 Tax=Dokdonella koreensis DS-123 TaxID=1300342 RepID=A0A160DTN2_9GAMM|nr:winged helix-turn-helix domain-containing protein [Dokdonella koreensis]ANB16963.1 Trans_reg_C domain containing protein [Dokdonella koreensis DS-123]
MAESAPASLAFDGIAIDVAGRRLLRDGAEQALEPKAFAVLALLAAAPGRVFTREEILDAVWGHRHVTPGVLNRIVTLVRQALGEDAQNARLLQTVHGVGYRFDPPASAAPTVDGVGDVPAAMRPAAPAPPRRARRGAVGLSLGLVAVLGLAFVAGGGLVRQRIDAAASLAAAAAPAPPPVLIVMPLKPIGGEEGSRVIAEGLSEELICSLARVDGLRVIAHTSTLVATTDESDTAGLVRRLGITHALEGNLQQAGQALRVRLRLVDTGSGSTVWVKDFDREVSEVLGLQRDVAHEVAASLALRMGLDPAAAIRSGDADFVRRSMEARALLARTDLPEEASVAVAENEFRVLVRERPTDARARTGLALALLVRSQRQPAHAPALREESLREAMIARQLDPTQPESYSVEAHAACDRNDWEHCLALREQARQMAPSNLFVVYANVVSLAELGYLDRAEALARDLSMRDPLAGSVHFILGRILDTQGRHDEARVELEQAGSRAFGARWLNAVWRGDLAGALRIAEADIASAPAAGFVATSRALADPALWPQAKAAFERAGQGTPAWSFLRVLAPDAGDDAAETIRQLDAMRHSGYSSWQLLLWSRDLAWLRRDPAFPAYLRDSGILDYWRKHGFPNQCRPVGDGAACD